MNHTLVDTYTDKLIDIIHQKTVSEDRTYGFEYEFISEEPLNPDHMKALYAYLPDCGFIKTTDTFRHPSGLQITFEPGGQIEYLSLPLYESDDTVFQNDLALIESTNNNILRSLGIKYVGKGYIPNRAETPLCLESKRYINLQDRVALSGSRGREMMKGTASIHLHVLIRDVSEIAFLFSTLCEMSREDTFKMGKERRNIWDNTDPTRCGMPYTNVTADTEPKTLVEKMVRFALEAYELNTNIPFKETVNNDFNAFIYHLTTIFTDVRLNLKGPTIELRTLDSMPTENFEPVWKNFTSSLDIL